MEHVIRANQKPLQLIEIRLEDHLTLPFVKDVSTKTLLLASGILFLTAYVVTKYFIYRPYFHPLKSIPGPRSGWIPLLGNMPDILFGDSCSTFKEWADKYGGLVCFQGTLNKPHIMVSDPCLLKQVLTIQHYNFTKSPIGAAIIKNIIGDGLFAAEGEVHRQQRKMLNPTFSTKVLRDLTPLFFVPVYQLANKWMNEINAKRSKDDVPVEIIVSQGISHLTMDVIGLAGFGQEFNVLRHHGTDKVNRISWGYETVFDSNNGSIVDTLGMIFPILRNIPTKRNQAINKAMKAIHEESRNIVEKCVSQAREEKESQVTHLLASMIQLSEDAEGNGFTAEELRIQSLSFLAAGHESTATTVSWCLWLLAQNQEIQDELRNEVTPLFQQVNADHPVFQDNPFRVGFDGANIPTYAAINSLHLLENVMRESSRVIPTVPFTSRVANKDVVLGDQVIPKGTHIHLPIIVNHHDKNVWGNDAEDFRPSRWDEEPGSNTGPYNYMPFLSGGRQCIGNRFANVEIKVILAILVMKFQFFEKPSFKITKQYGLTLRPFPNLTLLVKPVELPKQ